MADALTPRPSVTVTVTELVWPETRPLIKPPEPQVSRVGSPEQPHVYLPSPPVADSWNE